jgi:hypothetical protein
MLQSSSGGGGGAVEGAEAGLMLQSSHDQI